MLYDVIIIGSGPAGYTAAIYTGRANLKTLMLQGVEKGGQLMITSDVENFPGFPDGILGPDLMLKLEEQAKKFGSELIHKNVTKVHLENQTPFVIETEDTQYKTKSIIISTGASARFLDIPSEALFKGKGVSACATCDGFFFKDKEVVIIGGGDSAMEEAIFLTKFATQVTIIHRHDNFKASKIMLERAQKHPKIKFKTFEKIIEFYGDSTKGIIEGIKLQHTQTQQITNFKTQGVFIAIGHVPNTQIFKNQLDMTESGYLITQSDKTETNIPGVFAAGDVQDSYYRQAITAAGTGCMAAIECEKFIDNLS